LPNKFDQLIDEVETVLKTLYGDQAISVPWQSATFRRGDLIEKMKQFEV
jgi:hypothetical protein